MFKVPSGCVASSFGKSKKAINQWIRMGGVGDKIKRQLPGGRSKVNSLLLAKRIKGTRARLHCFTIGSSSATALMIQAEPMQARIDKQANPIFASTSR